MHHQQQRQFRFLRSDVHDQPGNLQHRNTDTDAADAAALALCYLAMSPMRIRNSVPMSALKRVGSGDANTSIPKQLDVSLDPIV